MNTHARAVTFGALLRDARTLRGLTPQQLAAHTGIPVGHIEAFEEGRLGAIPAGLYRRAEARAFADGVGLDPALVLRELEGAVDAPEPGTCGATDPDIEDPIADDPLVVALTATSAAQRPWYVTAPLYDLRPWRFAVVFFIAGAALWWEQPGAAPTVARPPIITAAVPVEAADEEAAAEDAGGAVGASIDTDEALATPAPAAVRRPRPQPALVVRTTPPGARVTVDGIGWGTTPVSIRHLPPGSKRIRVVKDRYRAEERHVQIAPGQPQRVSIGLRPVR